MASEDALDQFRKSYLAAVYQSQRLEAIRRFRAAQPEPPAAPDPRVLLPVLKGLLERTHTDGTDGRIAAARLFRYLWRGLCPSAIDAFLRDFPFSLLEMGPPLFTGERAIVLEALDGAFAAASPSVVGPLCREIVAREAARCRLAETRSGVWTQLEPPPAPNFDVLQLVVRRAPAFAWPLLVRDLWLLFNLDTDPVSMLTVGELLVRRRTRAGAKHRRDDDRVGRAGERGQWRLSSDGRRVGLGFCGEIARRLLRRTLEEARPDDLGDAAPGFFAWLEDLAGIPEEALEPLLVPMARWTVRPMARVLDRWSAGPYSREFRRQTSLAARRVRRGLGSEPVPAVAPPSAGNELCPAPAPAPADGAAVAAVPESL